MGLAYILCGHARGQIIDDLESAAALGPQLGAFTYFPAEDPRQQVLIHFAQRDDCRVLHDTRPQVLQSYQIAHPARCASLDVTHRGAAVL